MASKTFSDGEIIKHAWKSFQEHIGTLIASVVAGGVLVFLPLIVAEMFNSDIVTLLMMLVYLFMMALVSTGLIRIFLAISDGKKPSMELLVNGADRILPFLAVSILYGLIVTAGMFLFIIPGIIWGLRYMFAPWLVIDQKTGVMEALQKSKEMTDGLKWDLLGFVLLVRIIAGVGFIAFFVGGLVSVPVAMLSMARVYRTLGPKSAK